MLFFIALLKNEKGGEKMNKKIFMLTLMLLAMLTLTIIPVQAAPKTKQDFTLYWEAPMITDFDPLDLGVAAPKKSGGLDYPIQKTFHGREISQDILLATITIGTNVPLEWDDDFAFDSIFDFEFNWKTMCAVIKTKETIVFGDGSTIELSLVENGNYLTLTFEGTFVGHGTGALKGVKIVGTVTGGMKIIEIEPGVWGPEMIEVYPEVWVPVLAFTREGTIMGW